MIQTYLYTLFAPLFAGLNAFISCKKEDGHFFSKDYTTVLKGLCCIVVIYVHIQEPFGNSLQDMIGSFAYVCVTMFFLISAYGMLLSVEKKKDYLLHFWRNRLLSLLVPCLLVNLLTFVLNVINYKKLNCSLLFDLNSYVFVLLQWCVWFYIIESLKEKFFPKRLILSDILLIIGVVVSSMFNYFFISAENSAETGWCYERMGLVWGVLLYRYFEKIKLWMDKCRAVKILILFILGLVLGITYVKFKSLYFIGEYLLKILLGVILISLLFTATSNLKLGNSLSIGLGNISYEVYLSHHVIMSTLICWLSYRVNSGIFILLTVFFTVLISMLIHSLNTIIINKWRK